MRLAVALVRGLHGLRGAVRLEILTDHPAERFAPGALLFREGTADPLIVVESVPDGPGVRVRFAQIGERTAAEGLRGAYLEAEVDDSERPDGGAWWHEVVGLPVRATDGRELGSVADVYRAGGAEVYVVRGGPAGEFDLPAVSAFIRVFDPAAGVIVVDAVALGLDEPRPGAKARP